jgi:2'-hydroxyisoflavone reductase
MVRDAAIIGGVRLLVLGGTWFVGRALAEAAVARGWDVTCFNRGRTGQDVAGVNSVRGDRTVRADVERLATVGPWDAVVDTGAYEPPDVTLAAEVLATAASCYAVVSTVSAYQDWPASPVTEDSPLWPARLDAREGDPDVAAMPGAFAYGTLKAGCEKAARQAFGERTLVFRPGVVLGPYEYVGRLASLLGRATRGGRMLVAGDPDRAIQPVDVRDLAAFVLHLVRQEAGGTFNAVAPEGHATYGELIDACVLATGAQAELVWAEPQWATEQGVSEWTELVLWRSRPGTWAVDGRRAQTAGLVCRPIADTVFDTWAWLQREAPVPHPRAADHGLDPEREDELLAAWDAALLTRRGR